MEAGHESMKSLLTSPTDAPTRRSRASRGRSGVAEARKAHTAGWARLMAASPFFLMQGQAMPARPRALLPRRMFPAPQTMLQMKSWTSW